MQDTILAMTDVLTIFAILLIPAFIIYIIIMLRKEGKMIIHRGTIENVSGLWLSGLPDNITIQISGKQIRCDGKATVRALNKCFGNVILPDHMINKKAISGKEVIYALNDHDGKLSWFTPKEVWDKNPEISFRSDEITEEGIKWTLADLMIKCKNIALYPTESVGDEAEGEKII